MDGAGADNHEKAWIPSFQNANDFGAEAVHGFQEITVSGEFLFKKRGRQ